jgi:hypothetical protein
MVMAVMTHVEKQESAIQENVPAIKHVLGLIPGILMTINVIVEIRYSNFIGGYLIYSKFAVFI